MRLFSSKTRGKGHFSSRFQLIFREWNFFYTMKTSRCYFNLTIQFQYRCYDTAPFMYLYLNLMIYKYLFKISPALAARSVINFSKTTGSLLTKFCSICLQNFTYIKKMHHKDFHTYRSLLKRLQRYV